MESSSARNEKQVDPASYAQALDAFLAALGVDNGTVFEIVAARDGATIKHAQYTQKENGVMSGEFWDDVIVRRKRADDNK